MWFYASNRKIVATQIMNRVRSCFTRCVKIPNVPRSTWTCTLVGNKFVNFCRDMPLDSTQMISPSVYVLRHARDPHTHKCFLNSMKSFEPAERRTASNRSEITFI
jgi:hypothetical protein